MKVWMYMWIFAVICSMKGNGVACVWCKWWNDWNEVIRWCSIPNSIECNHNSWHVKKKNEKCHGDLRWSAQDLLRISYCLYFVSYRNSA